MAHWHLTHPLFATLAQHNLLPLAFFFLGLVLMLLLGNMERTAELERLALETRVTGEQVNLTAKLATLSRQQSANTKPMDLQPFVHEMCELLRRTMPAGLGIHVDTIPGPVLVRADETQIEQVILNLCFNARDAIEGMGDIRIGLQLATLDERFCRTHPELEPGEYALITVSDDGVGIPPEVLPRIFDPFFTTKQGESGTGLGLANCDSIVRQHNGVILAESEERRPAGPGRRSDARRHRRDGWA